MKKLYTLLFGVAVALSASAAINVTGAAKATRTATQLTGIQAATSEISFKKNAEVLGTASKANRIEPKEEWTDAGTVIFTDPWVLPRYAKSAAEVQAFVNEYAWEVPVQKSNRDRYKLIKPYGQPGFTELFDGEIISDPQDLIFDAKDPSMIEVEPQKIGVLLGDPNDPENDPDMDFYVTDLFGLFESQGYDAATIISAGYKPTSLEDGVITIPEGVFGESTTVIGYQWQTSAKEPLAPEGYVVFADAKDYAIKGAVSTDCWNNGSLSISWTSGADIASLKFVEVPGAWFEADNETLNSVETELADYLEDIAKEGTKALNPESYGRGPVSIFIIGYDADGSRVKGATVNFLVEPDNFYSEWKNIGRCKYTDDIVSSAWGTRDAAGNFTNWSVETFDVLVQESEKTPGLYRLVNPYQSTEWVHGSKNAHDGNHNHYLYIDASVPDKVSIPESYLGFELNGSHNTVISMNYLNMLNNKEPDPALWGTLVDGVITFPETKINANGQVTQCALLAGEVGDTGFYYSNGRSAFKLDLNTAGINDAVIDLDNNAPVEYFNLQGVRVANPEAGTLVIKRQGDKVTKTIIR